MSTLFLLIRGLDNGANYTSGGLNMQKKKRDQTGIHPELQDELLFRNRRRCCICRNPAKPVQIQQINSGQYLSPLNDLVIVCPDCFNLALTGKNELGDEYFRKELARDKHIWESECDAWRIGPKYSIRVNQGRWRDDVYGPDWVIVGSYKLDAVDQIEIDISSDELVSIEIRKEYLYGELSVRTFMESEIGYEFSLTFTPEKRGYYALIIEKSQTKRQL
jgi:hypothetical protein